MDVNHEMMALPNQKKIRLLLGGAGMMLSLPTAIMISNNNSGDKWEPEIAAVARADAPYR